MPIVIADALLPVYDLLKAEGACRSVEAAIMYPHDAAGVPRAKMVCRGCDHQAVCLELALTVPEPYGVWGGQGESDRRRMRRARRYQRLTLSA